MCKTRFGIQGVILDGKKNWKTLMELEPSLHGKFHQKFLFCFFENFHYSSLHLQNEGQDVNIRNVWNVIAWIIKWSKEHIWSHFLAFEISLRLSRAGSPGRQGVQCQLKKRNFSISVRRTALDDEIEDGVHNFYPYPYHISFKIKVFIKTKTKQIHL